MRHLGSRTGLALAGLWLLAGALAVRQARAILGKPVDERLPDLLGWLGDNGALQERGSLYEGVSPFTGTPLAGLVLTPLTRAAEQGLGVAWTFGTMALVVALGVVAVRALPGPLSPRARLFAVPVALTLLAVSVPVRNTFHLGQTSVLPVLLVLVGWLLTGRRARLGGVLTGLGAALQPAVLLFAVLLWLVRRREAAIATAASFAAATAVAWAALPGDSWTYWVHHLAGTGLGEPSDAVANQSLHGVLLRAGLRGPLEILLLLPLVVGVCWLALRRAVRYARDEQPLLAAAVTGCAVIAASPVAWQHQQLWVLLAVVGRVGKRSGDRLMWPVLVALVMSLTSDALVPKIAVLGPLGENAPLIAALLTACVIPFMPRTSETWDRPLPSGPLSRPNLMLELMLIRVGYWAYSYVRGHAPDGRDLAEGHGEQILRWESVLHIDMEHALNLAAARTPWLEAACNYYYTTFHFLVPLSLLAWLYLRRPGTYRKTRTALSFATLLALIGFYFYPLAPPRLMPGLGYIDTAHGPQDLEDPDFGALTEISNQYAAMPSLHVGWSLWCAVVIFLVTRRRWIRALGALYPLLTTYVVMATANHYLLDAVGGAIVVGTGFWLAHLIARAKDRHAPEEPETPEGAGSPSGPKDTGSAGEAKDAAVEGSGGDHPEEEGREAAPAAAEPARAAVAAGQADETKPGVRATVPRQSRSSAADEAEPGAEEGAAAPSAGGQPPEGGRRAPAPRE
nr:bifunctional glycosyltransferase 87/phosphatase PAP2 family protein [Streptomyces sp. AJS327]